ncbi:hypothetical protein [Mycolicibacterium stellerae]|uniref:hypothetical protein n=1 Tax=Mycolicibacterium stellerae TaxID=2358193 RepID=UPI000F0AFF43|nr:hypothetical protein [Mycolicibacterium stellerae]
MIDDIAQWDAAYVLGALSRQDRRDFEVYLAVNPERAAALTELAGLPGVLNRLSRDEAIALTEQPADAAVDPRSRDLMPSLASVAAKRHRRSRRSMLAAGVAAAAVVAIGAGVIGADAFSGPGPQAAGPAYAAMQPMKIGLNAALAVTEKKWGTRLDWTCEYVEDWARSAPAYDIVVTTIEGVESTVGTWRPAGDRGGELAASTAIPTAEIHTVDIRVSGTHEPLAVTTVR